MGKIFIITSLQNSKEELLQQLITAGVKKESMEIHLYSIMNEEHILARIRIIRPFMIIVDGRGHLITLNNLCEAVSSTIGTYDVDTILYSIFKKINFRGVVHTSIEDAAKMLVQQSTCSETPKQDDICQHRTQSRIITHRGVHCGDCGKRF